MLYKSLSAEDINKKKNQNLFSYNREEDLIEALIIDVFFEYYFIFHQEIESTIKNHST